MVIDLPNVYLISCSEHSLDVAFFLKLLEVGFVCLSKNCSTKKVSMYNFITTMVQLEISLL